MRTPDSFVKEYTGKAIAYDGPKYGVQCVGGFKVGCVYVGTPVVACPNDWAESYWTCRNKAGNIVQTVKNWQTKYFDLIGDYRQFRNGDWVVWPSGSKSHPLSHIAMYYNGQQFGQRQYEDNRAFCLKDTDFSDAYGALRPKAWVKEEVPYGYSKLIRSGITALVYRGNRAAGYSLHVLSADGATALKNLAGFNTDKVVKVAVVNAGYFQMAEGQEDPYGTHYGVEQDAAAGNTYTQAPKQSGVLAFYEDKQGNCGYCTADQYFGKPEEVNFAITPYAVRIHEGKKVFGRSVNYGDKDDTPNTQTAAVKFSNGDWAVAVFPDKICPRDTVTFFDNFSGIQELILMDSGGSTQMRAWNVSKQKMEDKLSSTRKIPNVLIIAKINDASDTPDAAELEPTDEPIVIPIPEEKEEDEPMAEETNTPIEVEPVENWTDPEQQTSIIKERIAALLEVKSIITLTCNFVFAYLVINQLDIPPFFQEIYKVIIIFFFGYQAGKAKSRSSK